MSPFPLPKDFDLTAYAEGEPFDVTATLVLKDGSPVLQKVNDMEVAMAEDEEAEEESDDYEMDTGALQKVMKGGMM
jgi:hypothetical protein